jgi:hypothetical protein
MIMPAIFGAFGNFLLPTQLGVHDVAFPRLNSAAFWFLPGGLIMLMQLVCVDRRYQRMNCFNIRELQGILKRKFFTDLINTNDHREFLNQSIIGLRFKSNNDLAIIPEVESFFNLGTTLNTKSKNITLESTYAEFSLFNTNHFYINPSNALSLGFCTIRSYINNIMTILSSLNMYSCLTLFHLPTNFFSLVTLNLGFGNFNQIFVKAKAVSDSTSGHDKNVSFVASNNATTNTEEWSNTLLSEASNNLRFTKFQNPLISYDYKCGHYLGIWESLYPSLMTSYIEVARGIRKAPWFFSDQYTELLKNNKDNFIKKFTSQTNLKLADVDNWYSSHVAPIDNFFNITYIFKQNNNFIHTRWVSLNSLDQKFYKMFDSSSTQQRVLANWRQLKFSREAWRCKLLAARHQNTLYRRFTGEDGLVYAIERNAKDLLPGWAMVTPFSARTRFTAIGKVDVGLMGVFLAINASIVSSANFLVTYRYLSTLNNRKMRDARSFFSEGLITASWMMIAANPMLAIGILMLLSDRHWQTSFFDYSGGGDTVLFQHMFWFFGHPEVYIIMLPVFGFTNTMMSFYLRKRVSARASLLYSMYTIAFLGFFVW